MAGLEMGRKVEEAVFAAELERAREGDHAAQLAVGRRFVSGNIVPADGNEALRWFETASKSRNPEIRLEALYESATLLLGKKDVVPDFRKAAGYFGIVAKSKHVLATHALIEVARMKLAGNGMTADPQGAVTDLTAVGNRTKEYDHDIGELLCLAYRFGFGRKKDDTIATFWLERSAKAGNGRAQLGLVDCYLNGRGVKADIETAYKWLDKAYGTAIVQHDASLASDVHQQRETMEALLTLRRMDSRSRTPGLH